MKRKEPTHSEDPIYGESSSSTSPQVGDYEGGTKRPKGNYCEVFLSFRGDDTRKGFTDHLYNSLDDAGIQVFRDDNELPVGEKIGLELLCSIANSKISIPIISENYTSSKWCLRELAEMLKCKRSKGQIVDVSHCGRLKNLPAGVGRMVKLRELRINDTYIQEIPISRGCLMELETLCVGCCKRLSQLPKSMGSLVSLTLLDLSYLAIEELPESIGSMKKLETLNASECRLLACIPSSIGNLASLQSLLLYGCCSLTEIPDSIEKLASLTELDLGYTSITKLPESIGNMPNLRILDIRDTDITELPDAIGKLAKLQRLEARRCKKLGRLPSNICGLVSLEELSLGYSVISSLPESISMLSSLQELHVAGCEKLRELPELPSGLRFLSFTCQRSPLPHLSQLTRLKALAFCNCPWLERVPELPIGLSKLNINCCGKLKEFTNLSNLRRLSYLRLYEGSHCLFNLPVGQCPKISGVDGIEDSSTLMSPKVSPLDGSPDFSDSKILQRMDATASCANSVEIQDPGGSKSSQVSDILKCTSAGRLLDFSSFKYSRTLWVWRCNSVTEIQGPDGSESLTYLSIDRCSSLRSVDLSNIKNLQDFYLYYCENLVEIRGLEGLGPLRSFRIYACPSLRQSPDLLRLKALATEV